MNLPSKGAIKRVYNLLRIRGCNKEQIEDIIQDAYVRLIELDHKDKLEENVNSLFIVTCINLWKNSLRDSKNERSVFIEMQPSHLKVGDGKGSAEDYASAREHLNFIVEGIHDIPNKKHRDVIIKMFLEGESYKDIYEKTSLSPESVRQIVFRYRKFLKEYLEE